MATVKSLLKAGADPSVADQVDKKDTLRNFASSSILTSTIIRNLVDVYSDQERNRESQLPSGVEPRPSDQ